MPTKEENDYYLDNDGPDFNPHFLKFDLPSDKLTLGQVRRDQPRLLMSTKGIEWGWGALSISTLIGMELEFAERTWAKAVGEPVKPERESWDKFVDGFNEFYVDLGLSSGPKQTEEILRRFETQVTQVAKQAIGEGRG
jgi:hypothetical protein